MGRRGPPPTPTNVLGMRGSRLAKRRTEEPRPKVKAPRPPKYLDKLAKQEWRRVVKQLLELRVISELDRGVLARYCQAASDVERLTLKVRKDGEVVTGAMGGPVRNPISLLLKEAHDRMLAAERELGLTPSARTRVKSTPKSPEEDGLGAFVGERRRPA